MNTLPDLRLIHHLARTGGTIIAKCIGSMGNTTQLSEINPAGLEYFDPLEQATDWYGLFTENEVIEIRQKNPRFNELIKLIHSKTIRNNKPLLIRDWSHLNYLGLPFLENPDYKLALAESLKDDFNLKQICSVRHPIYQFFSTIRLQFPHAGTMKWLSEHPKMSVRFYMKGYLEFAKQAKCIGFIKYEDFCTEPDRNLEFVCNSLEIDFNSSYSDRWYNYDFTTGDDKHNKHAALAIKNKKIMPMGEKEIPENIINYFNQCADYHESLELLSYSNL